MEMRLDSLRVDFAFDFAHELQKQRVEERVRILSTLLVPPFHSALRLYFGTKFTFYPGYFELPQLGCFC